MKKQILILFLLALFAGTFAYGQALPGSAPRPVSCVDDALHPIAGKPYEYTVGVDPTGGNFKWVATKNSTFISAAGILPDSLPTDATNLLATSLNYGDIATSDKVTITWSDAILQNTTYNTNPTFVAVHYSGTSCADNMKAYQIDPIQAFVVDIKNIDDGAKTILGYDIAASQCIANIASATFDGTGMLYDYGIDTLYYEVIAANFTGSWDPTFAVTGLNAVQTSTLEWTYSQPSTWDALTVWNPENTLVSTNETNTSAGVSIYVRLIVANNKYEGLTASTIRLAVDGQNSLGHWDVVNTDCSSPNAADVADFAEQTITPRPTINAGTSSTIGTNTTLIPAN